MPLSLSNYFNEFKPQILGGLTGAGIGAAGLGGMAALSSNPDKAQKSRDVKRNLLLGAALGGLTGTGIGAMKGLTDNSGEPGLLNQLFGSKTLHGAAGAAAVNRGIANTEFLGRPIIGTRGAHKSQLDTLSDKLREQVEGWHKAPINPTGGVSPVEGVTDVLQSQSGGDATKKLLQAISGDNTNITKSTLESDMRNTIDQLTSNKGTFGRLSQQPFLRHLGLNTTPAGGENAVVAALKPLLETSEGQTMVQRLLSEHHGAGRQLPFIAQDLNAGGTGELLRRVNGRSTLTRLGLGGALWGGALEDGLKKLLAPNKAPELLK